MQNWSFVFYIFPTELCTLIQEFTGCSAETRGWKEINTPEKTLHGQVQTVTIKTSEQVAGPDKRTERTFTEDQISPPDLCLTVHKHSDVLIKTKKLIRLRAGTMWLFRDWSIPASLRDTSTPPHSSFLYSLTTSYPWFAESAPYLQVPKTKPCTCSSWHLGSSTCVLPRSDSKVLSRRCHMHLQVDPFMQLTDDQKCDAWSGPARCLLWAMYFVLTLFPLTVTPWGLTILRLRQRQLNNLPTARIIKIWKFFCEL